MKKLYSVFSAVIFALFVASCTSDMEMMKEVGYLKLEINTVTSTHTRATNPPANYDARQLYVEVCKEDGSVVKSTEDFTNDKTFKENIILAPGKYTINAHSANWDGSGSGFDAPYYTGSTTVNVAAKTLSKANITCTQANVKVTINYDASFKTYFSEAYTIVNSKTNGVAALTFYMNADNGSAYFPVDDLVLLVSATSKETGSTNSQTNTITNVKARDHYIINYKVADAGNEGIINVYTDDATQTYTYDLQVPRKPSTSLQANKANAWSNFAELNGIVASKTSSFDASGVTLQYQKKGDANWTTIENNQLNISGDSYSYKLTNLTPETSYSFRLSYNDNGNAVNSNIVDFTTEKQETIYNNSFENWWKKGNCWYPNEENVIYWDSSNPGPQQLAITAYEKNNVTTLSTDYKNSGNGSAKLETKALAGVLAAASLYTGSFESLQGTSGAELNWGVKFNSRPTKLKGYMRYTPAAINKGTKPNIEGVPEKKESDYCQIYCALVTETFKVANTENTDGYELSTKINWENDERVIAYGELSQNTANSDWTKFNIPLKYHDLVTKPKYMIIVCSSSKYGDYFYGGEGSTLYLDDFSFEYGEPTLK